MLGAGALGLGLLKGFPDVPQTTPALDQIQSQIQAGGGPLGQQARDVLSGQLSRQFDPLTDAEITAATRQIDEAEKRAEDQIRDVYRSIRPGTSEFTDTALAQELEDNRICFAHQRADTVAGLTRGAQDRFNQQQFAQVQQALGASDQEIAQLSQIAQLEIGQIMAQLGLDAEQARLFKETFLNLGSSLIQPPGLMERFLTQQLAQGVTI